MTVQNAIAIAGGFSARANQRNVDITRKINGKIMTGRVRLRIPSLLATPSMCASGCSNLMTAQEPLRILHCFRSPVGGIFRHVRDLAEEHAKAGHQVGILCDSTTGGTYEDKLFETIMPHLTLGLTRLPIRRSLGLSDISTAVKTFRKVKNLQPDVLHGHGAKVALSCDWSAHGYGYQGLALPVFIPPRREPALQRESLRGQAYFAIERLLERWTDSLVFVSDYERSTYEKKIGTPRASWRLIHNGLRENEFEPVDAADAVDFLYIGMMRDLKGPDVFIEALRRAEQLAGRPLRGVMVGDGDDKPRYQARIDMLGLGERVENAGCHACPQGFRDGADSGHSLAG
jgi:glycosyltransferase involved in cell wall biosynthesis